MKWSRDRRFRVAATGGSALLAAFVSLGAVRPLLHVTPLLFHPGHSFDRWTENVPAGSGIESALYRLMDLPGGTILFRRTPHEAVPALTELQQSQKYHRALFALPSGHRYGGWRQGRQYY